MASEGMDIPALNTVILATPKSDVKQSVGRIFRQQVKDRTHIPLIIDIVDQIPNFVRQSSKRKTLYRKCGYIFKYLDKDLNPLYILTPKKTKNKPAVSELDRHTSLKFSSCLFDSDDD